MLDILPISYLLGFNNESPLLSEAQSSDLFLSQCNMFAEY